MSQPTPRITTEIINLTPEYAAELLTRNPRNRKMSAKNYRVIHRAVTNGEWALNGEAIKISVNNEILDGQHRCLVVKDTGITIPTIIIRGLPAETQDTMDTGKSRGLNDFLTMNDEKNVTTLGALIRRFMVMEGQQWTVESAFAQGGVAARTFTVRESLRWFEKNQWVRDYVPAARDIQAHTPMAGAAAGVLVYSFEAHDVEDSQYFWARIKDGQNLKAGSPILALNKAFKILSDNTRGERNQRYLAAITVKAWISFREGTDVQVLRFRSGGASPEAFPEPK